MTLRIDSSRRLTWGLSGLVVLLAAGLGWSLIRWRHAERQTELAQQQLAEAQRLRQAAPPAVRVIPLPRDTRSDSGVPAHIDAGMLIDGAEMNSKRAIKKAEPLERAKVVPNGEIVPWEIDAGMLLDEVERNKP